MAPLLPALEINREAIHSAFSTASSGFAYYWRDLHHQAVKDFRARWWSCLLWLLAFAWLLALFISFGVLIATGIGSLGDRGACLPDGRFAVDPSMYRYFSGSGFFEITLGFGRMSFTQVKAIDVSWDILVGRGGQAIVAYISCSFGIAQFVIHDGWRIKIDGHQLEGNQVVTDTILPGYGPYGYHAVESPTLNEGTPKYSQCAMYYNIWERSPEECHLQLNITDYVRQYGLYGTNKTNSTFMGSSLESPVLNISAFYLPYEISSSIFPESELGSREEARFSNESLIRWEYDNSTWTRDELQARGKCQAVLDYQWGFSFIQLFIMIILLLIWTVGIYIMWLRSNSTMKRRGTTEVAGENKAVFELADAMRDQMGEKAKEEGDDVSAMTEANLRRRVKKDLRGGSIAYATPLLANGEPVEDWTLKSWFKRHKWSIVSMVIHDSSKWANPTG
ncbi:hypothetical protein DDE82_003431 [Stemphylium lycopersici]|uniref:Uncharacterized protein n=1 Tax=Stemphylium lycopersici TaxID=183478 RepID=A0A364N8J2_STELY|nr:hypothetical protein DDE82_003431 [Stemphylium lycopersici]RAR13644.1 hypothetical protein DDE83_002966 [Stemphylium lycopersici]